MLAPTTRVDAPAPDRTHDVIVLLRQLQTADTTLARAAVARSATWPNSRRRYDRAHALIGRRGGVRSSGELRHHCATGDHALYIIGVWESEAHVRRWESPEFATCSRRWGFRHRARQN